ncbi:ATP-dependent helicase [Thalassospira sp. A40-3]|uniref:UvrD-helicase domain-containing protein n=1 Tax=Thalassospira sp. A40-3 TaxID=2785908 RepID=UPI0018CD041A|nr:UvrD-helicase domain-containing protein [Thalassospira sp. A40-3]QPO13259.1 ATP-dependent helicase [Thalassospira sp. A40-3]
MTEQVADNHVDDIVDEQIRACLNFENPRSFFLFAGAGSGKTRSLVNAIDFLRSAHDSSMKNRRWLQVRGKKVAVITFTNAARDEIVDRTKRDPLVVVHTIHSFSWLLIKSHQSDIRTWLKKDIQISLDKMKQEQAARKRTDTKIYGDTERSIASKQDRLLAIDEIPEFIYSPSGDNKSKDSLSHGEVLKIVTSFLSEKPTIQRILVDAFPVLLIDESQDTNRHLLEALLKVQASHDKIFSLGLLGDTMQRIYADGHHELGKPGFVPEDWAKPAKKMNHRSRKRIVDLVNAVRSEVDEQKQQPRSDKPGGWVRLFVIDRSKFTQPLVVEERVRQCMADVTGDVDWVLNAEQLEDPVKTLILEHHMAAARMGFSDMFDPLYRVSDDTFRTNLLKGSLPSIRFFCLDVAELVDAVLRDDEFAIARIVQDKSPILDKKTLFSAGERQGENLKKAKSAVENLRELLEQNQDPSLLELLNVVSSNDLFQVPRSLIPFLDGAMVKTENGDEGIIEDVKSEIGAWRVALDAPLSQARKYIAYVSGKTGFDTHQGVKGLEFPRVMVVINDDEARGFLFSYDTLFGAKEKSKRDLENEAAGLDNASDRTRRLLYVTSSRAEDSLAIVAYTDNPRAVTDTATSSGIFLEDEIIAFE